MFFFSPATSTGSVWGYIPVTYAENAHNIYYLIPTLAILYAKSGIT